LLQKGSQKSMIWVKKTPVLASSISAPNNHVHLAISQFQPVLVDALSLYLQLFRVILDPEI